MIPSDFAQLAIAGGSAGGMFGLVLVAVRWCANFIAGRLDKREEHLGRKEEHLDAGTQRLIVQLQEQVNGLIEAKATTDKLLAECLDRDIEMKRRVAQLEGLTAGLGDARQHAALIVASEKRKDQPK
jgi:hypothetical protein